MKLYSDCQVQCNMQYQDNIQHNIHTHILVIMIIISLLPANFITSIKFEQIVNVGWGGEWNRKICNKNYKCASNNFNYTSASPNFNPFALCHMVYMHFFTTQYTAHCTYVHDPSIICLCCCLLHSV